MTAVCLRLTSTPCNRKQNPARRNQKTGIGEFIRKTSLDEFPQFWNVLNGTMSLVGTRPILQDELQKYELHHRARIAIKPGITGMWQVSGRSDITDFEEVVRLDTEYISNWTFGLDIKILFKTVMTVLKRERQLRITYNRMERKLAVSMFGQKRLSRESGIEIVAKELCTRMVQNGVCTVRT